jgi:hypothetical protein
LECFPVTPPNIAGHLGAISQLFFKIMPCLKKRSVSAPSIDLSWLALKKIIMIAPSNRTTDMLIVK